jgi:hypothetical protein
MNKVTELFTSRKFLLTLGAVLTNIGGGLTGDISWNIAIPAITVAVAGWVTAQGKVDAATKNNAPVAPAGGAQ